MPEESKAPELTPQDIDNAPTSTPPSRGDVTVSREDYVQALTQVSEDKTELQIEYEKLQIKVKTAQILDGLIEPYARKTYWFMCSYCGFVGLVLLMHGFGCFNNPLSDSVLEFLVGSTAVTVIGLVGMVLTGIFVKSRH